MRIGEQRICGTCEYFDGGGENAVKHALASGEPLHGDCLNRNKPPLSDLQRSDMFGLDSKQ